MASNVVRTRDNRRAAGGGAALIEARGARAVVCVGVNGPVWPVVVFTGAMADVPVVPLNYRLPAEQLLGLIAQIADPLVIDT